MRWWAGGPTPSPYGATTNVANNVALVHGSVHGRKCGSRPPPCAAAIPDAAGAAAVSATVAPAMPLEKAVSLAVVRDVLGHADLATTSIYLRTEQKTIARELAKLKAISRVAHFSER